VVLILLGIIGLFAGNRVLGLNSDILEDIIHILAGAVALYAGFGTRDPGPAIQYARIFGVIYLILGVLGFILPTLFGLLPSRLLVLDNIVHLLLGLIGVYVGFAAADRTATV
jgi:uncharacterized membrane protein